jgi:hypothetical protein
MINRIFIAVFCFSLFVSTQQILAISIDNNKTTEWELISETNNIKVLERWVINEKELKVKERTGKMIINCSVNDVINLIKDTKRTPLWMKDAEQVKKLKVEGDNIWYVHTILDTPWPFNKQDMVSRYDIKEDKDHKTVRILISQDDKLVPKIKGVDRLDTFNAEWDITYIKGNKVKVTFTTISTKPPKYPSWAQDPVVRRVFINNLKNFKNLLNNKNN